MIRLSVGGPSWIGWTFGRYGRAKEWRLLSPGGCHYTASEIEELRALVLDVDYLRGLVRDLNAVATPKALHFSESEALILAAASELLANKITPRRIQRGLSAPAIVTAREFPRDDDSDQDDQPDFDFVHVGHR